MQFSLSQLTTAVITAGTIAAGVVVYIKSEQVNLLKEQVSAYKAIDDIGLEKLTKDAAMATSELQETLSNLTERKSLMVKVEAQEAVIEKLEASNKTQQRKIKSLESQINSLFSSHSSFSLKDEEHIKLFEAKYVVAIRRVQSEDVYLSLNNEGKFLRSGEYLELTNNDVPCKLFLENFKSWDVANFSLLCEKI